MEAATHARDNPLANRLMVIDPARGIAHGTVGELPAWLRAGDLLVVNDAATVPASLRGTFSSAPIELRLAAPTDDPVVWQAVVFGAGDWRTRTEHRPAPPPLAPGDVLRFGDELTATVRRVSERSARMVTVCFAPDGDRFWRLLYALGRPVQYAHAAGDFALYDVQTVYAGRPWSVEMPSAGAPLRWSLLDSLAGIGVAAARLTHAAGLSATGDDALDALLPLPERYEIPPETVDAVNRTRAAGGRVVAVGTSVVRALEGSARTHGALTAGAGETDLRVGEGTARRVVDAVLSGMHEPGTSHFELLTAFVGRGLLQRATAEGEGRGYLVHEFGDSCLVLAA